MIEEIRNAISAKNIIEFDYGGHSRVVEPHVLGINQGQYGVLVYQVGGSSSSGSPLGWRRMFIDGISGYCLTDDEFDGPRPYPSGSHSKWDQVIAFVE